jgi:hypothetical protein
MLWLCLAGVQLGIIPLMWDSESEGKVKVNVMHDGDDGK